MAHSTVYDVANKAGVSIATVSRVVNSPDKVNPETRRKVLSVIDQLGYVPKAEAAVRARKSAGRIAVLAPFFYVPIVCPAIARRRERALNPTVRNDCL